jgi:hypothetical protein
VLVAVQVDPLARVLGYGWPTLHCSELADRARELEKSAGFARSLLLFMGGGDYETAGEALAALAARQAPAAEWEHVTPRLVTD